VKRHVLLLDNLDSFTFNLLEAFQRLGAEVQVLRNRVDPRRALAIAKARRSLLVLSPGPGSPDEAGCMLPLIEMAKGVVPVLGICLGHQGIVQAAGGKVAPAAVPVHGKVSLLRHDGLGPFAGFTGPVQVGRYHSLCTRDIPSRFRVHAELEGMAMAISDPEARQTGLQFHPESILTRGGDRMLANVLGEASQAPPRTT
jgi:anthranilate synthase/aminodeoxychorismate synthase-like glutamine amidotransferase